MILVLLGTQNNGFYRLLEEIDKLKSKGIIKDKIIVQAGHTKYQSNQMELLDLIPKEELDKYIHESNIVITHGGVGSIIFQIHSILIISVLLTRQYFLFLTKVLGGTNEGC